MTFAPVSVLKSLIVIKKNQILFKLDMKRKEKIVVLSVSEARLDIMVLKGKGGMIIMRL